MKKYKCFFDGATYPKNPGVIGYGYLIEDPEGKIVFEHGEKLRHGTNNQAEYHALINLMLKLTEMNIENAVICGDSQLIINQTTGAWKVNAEDLKGLNLEARKLFLLNPFWELVWIPREQNKKADALSKKPFLISKPKLVKSKKAVGKVVVKHVKDSLWVARGSKDLYIVDLEANTCECPDFVIRGRVKGTCKHIDACRAENDAEIPF